MGEIAKLLKSKGKSRPLLIAADLAIDSYLNVGDGKAFPTTMEDSRLALKFSGRLHTILALHTICLKPTVQSEVGNIALSNAIKCDIGDYLISMVVSPPTQ